MVQKLIDANKLYLKTGEIDAAPTVDAIPVSWINDYLWHIMATNKIKSVEERAFRMMGIKDMLSVWEYWGKENATD